jgi:hypothetical protein
MNSVRKTANNMGNAAYNVANNIRNNVANVANNVANVANNAANNFAYAANNMMNNVANTVLGNNSAAEAAASALPWGLIIIGALVITAITLIVVFYDKIKEALPASVSDIFSGPKEEKAAKEVTKAPPTNVEAPAPASMVESILPGKKEVFNVSSNRYMYEDAEPLCRALGAELATYDQVKAAFDSGADWCNYGWTKGQLALYPTQKGTYDKLQLGPAEQKLACGRPGLNGGYFDNSELRFGVNCYGIKPAQSEHDSAAKSKGTPISPDAFEFDKKVALYKSEADHIDILPFRDGAWAS